MFAPLRRIALKLATGSIRCACGAKPTGKQEIVAFSPKLGDVLIGWAFVCDKHQVDAPVITVQERK